MNLTRRQALITALSAAAVAGILPRSASAQSLEEAMAAFTGGAEASEGGVIITAPEIAENGNTVPVEVESEGAVRISVFAAGNPNPGVATFAFGPLAAVSRASTRIRLVETQDVVVIAEMADGTYQMAAQEVKVTIGGCGG